MAPICVIVGVVLLWYLILLRRNRIQQIRRSDAAILSEWAVMFVLVAMSLFWIATDYSVAVGQTPPSSESAYHFRYHGLVLLIEIGGRYVSGASGLGAWAGHGHRLAEGRQRCDAPGVRHVGRLPAVADVLNVRASAE